MVTVATLALAGCNAGGSSSSQGNEDTRKALDALNANLAQISTQLRDGATANRATAEDVKTIAGRLAELQKAVSDGLANQKRGALYLRLDVEAPCENDDQCAATARSVCDRINYANGITSRFTPGPRPTLGALVCFD